jgi:hypothetical protein
LSVVRSSWKLKSTRAERSVGVEGSGSVSVYTHVRRAKNHRIQKSGSKCLAKPRMAPNQGNGGSGFFGNPPLKS